MVLPIFNFFAKIFGCSKKMYYLCCQEKVNEDRLLVVDVEKLLGVKCVDGCM